MKYTAECESERYGYHEFDFGAKDLPDAMAYASARVKQMRTEDRDPTWQIRNVVEAKR